MTDRCFVCGCDITSRYTTLLPYPCFLAGHEKCVRKFIRAFKRYYKFSIDISKMKREFNTQWGFSEEEVLLEFMEDEGE